MGGVSSCWPHMMSVGVIFSQPNKQPVSSRKLTAFQVHEKKQNSSFGAFSVSVFGCIHSQVDHQGTIVYVVHHGWNISERCITESTFYHHC